LKSSTIFLEKKLIAITAITAVLAACGGGGGSTSTAVQIDKSNQTAVQTEPQSPTSTPSSTTYFQKNYNLPSFKNLVSGLCADSKSGGTSASIALADMNGDGKKDIIQAYWCGYSQPGGYYNGPTPNTVIVYLSQPDGSYVIGNKTLFGSDIVDIGGQGLSMVVADFNNDGKPDIGIGISKEDGRFQDISTWEAPQTILVSNKSGSYTVQQFFPVAASGTVQAVPNDVGGFDFVYPTSPASPVAAFRWQNNNWVQITSYPSASVGMYFLPSTSPNGGSTSLITNPNTSAGPSALELKSCTNGVWESLSTYGFPASIVDAISWNGNLVKTNYSTVLGIKMLYATFESECSIKLTPNSANPIILARMLGFPTPPSWDGVSLLDERGINGISFLVPFSMAGGVLKPIDTVVFDKPLLNQSFTNYQCIDINGDDYQDVVINLQGSNIYKTIGTPVFYINNKNGQLIQTTVADLPQPPQNENGWGDSNSAYEDINGDGIKDLLYFTSYGFNLTDYQVQIYYGKRNVGN
jgi:hypothetical protein